MKTVNDLIKELSRLRDDFKDKPVKIIAENGELFDPSIRLKRKDKYDVFSEVEEIILTW